MPRSTSRHAAAALLVAATVATPSLVAAQVHAQAAPGASTATWSLRPELRAESEYDNNVFLLPDLKKGRLAAGAPAGTRYADMVASADVITTVSGSLDFTTPGIAGKRMRIAPAVAYEYYARNTARAAITYGFDVAQRTARGGEVRLRAAMHPQTFFKNYLADGVDRDLDGSITPDERLYAAAKQGETTFDADYTFRLRKQRAASPFGAALRVGGGWYSRSYNAPFASRELTGPTANGLLRLSIASGTRLDFGYAFASLAAPRVREVSILDETRFDRDFNGNGTMTDVQARAFEMVDRSRREQELNAALSSDLGRAEIQLEYAGRTRRFSSSEPYDIANNGRRDLRHEVGATLRYDLGSAAAFRAAVRRGAQTLNRSGAAVTTGDVADYTRLRTSLGLELRF